MYAPSYNEAYYVRKLNQFRTIWHSNHTILPVLHTLGNCHRYSTFNSFGMYSFLHRLPHNLFWPFSLKEINFWRFYSQRCWFVVKAQLSHLTASTQKDTNWITPSAFELYSSLLINLSCLAARRTWWGNPSLWRDRSRWWVLAARCALLYGCGRSKPLDSTAASLRII